MRFRKWLAAAAMALLLPTCSSAVYLQGVPNLREVDPGVWRGGEPTHEGWTYLRSLGVKTVVKLNDDAEYSDGDARALGMKVVYVPMEPKTFVHALDGPTPAEVATALGPLLDARDWPIYVHCSHGQDRTGLVVGMFRVLHDHWTKDAAWREMRADGFHSGFIGLVHSWNRFQGTVPAAK